MSNFTLPINNIKIETQETEVNSNKIDNLEKKNNKKYTDSELDELDFGEAIIFDKRTYLEYYWYLLKQNHLIIFTFLPIHDYKYNICKNSLIYYLFKFFFYYKWFFLF